MLVVNQESEFLELTWQKILEVTWVMYIIAFLHDFSQAFVPSMDNLLTSLLTKLLVLDTRIRIAI